MAICIAVALSGQLARTLHELRSDLRSRWNVGLSHPGDLLHLTLVTVEGNPRLDQLRNGLAATAEKWAPFPISGAGIGVFTSRGPDSPVVCLALTRTPRLASLHDEVTQAALRSAGSVDGLTQAEFWRPHVTLADDGLTAAVAGEIVCHLLERGPRHWTVDVDNIALVLPDGTISRRFPLRGASGAPDGER